VPAPEPFSRIYHRLADEFPQVYDSPDLAGYVRLLVAADQSWPTSARWAGLVSKATLGRLVSSSLVILDGSRYRIRGLDRERESRSQSASHAARSRWSDAPRNADGNATRNATRNAETMPSREEKSREETRRDEHIARARLDESRDGLPHLTPQVQEAVERVMGRPITTASDKVLTSLDELVERHGVPTVTRTMADIAASGKTSWPEVVFGSRNALQPIPGSPDSKAERERAEQSAHDRRKAAEARNLDEPWRRELRERLRQEEATR
jgi:hypothetical protein